MKYFLLTSVFLLGLLITYPLDTLAQKPSLDPPNVLFLLVDDLNDWVLHPDQHPQVKTPNMDRLREKSLSFTNAHATVPVCGPSRLTLLSGLMPEKVDFKWNWHEVPRLQDCTPLPLHFRNNGYGVYGIGKVFHQGGQGDYWTEFGTESGLGTIVDYGPYPWDGISKSPRMPHPGLLDRWGWKTDQIKYMWAMNYGPLADVPDYAPDAEKGVPGYRGWRYMDGKPFFYKNDSERDKMPDEIYADWAVEMLQRKHEDPFFITVGFVRPHVPLTVPSEYFDMYPLESIKFPPYTENDLEDCAQVLVKDHYLEFFNMYQLLARTEDQRALKEWVQAYLACITFVDDQIGKVLDALEKSEYADNTIVILAGDHGQHLGEKETLGKFNLWEESTRVPLFLQAPGLPAKGANVDHPVTLLDIYPTLVDLCGLPKDPNRGKSNLPLDGFSLRPFLDDPKTRDWDGPPVALSAIYEHQTFTRTGEIIPHYTVRSEQYRYTRCDNGEEELYDHTTDPNEWYNLADEKKYRKVKQRLNGQLTGIIGLK